MSSAWNNSKQELQDDSSSDEWTTIGKTKEENKSKSKKANLLSPISIDYKETIAQVFKNWPAGHTMTYIILKYLWEDEKQELGYTFTITSGIHQKNMKDELHFSVLVYTSTNNAFYLHFNGHLFNNIFWVKSVSAETNRGREGLRHREIIALYADGEEVGYNGPRNKKGE